MQIILKRNCKNLQRYALIYTRKTIGLEYVFEMKNFSKAPRCK